MSCKHVKQLLLVPQKFFQRFFYCFSLFSDWLKSNHLRNRIERGFLEIFSRHICSAVTKITRVINYATSFGPKNVPITKFEAAERNLDQWNQQLRQSQNFITSVSENPRFLRCRFCNAIWRKKTAFETFSTVYMAKRTLRSKIWRARTFETSWDLAN